MIVLVGVGQVAGQEGTGVNINVISWDPRIIVVDNIMSPEVSLVCQRATCGHPPPSKNPDVGARTPDVVVPLTRPALTRAQLDPTQPVTNYSSRVSQCRYIYDIVTERRLLSLKTALEFAPSLAGIRARVGGFPPHGIGIGGSRYGPIRFHHVYATCASENAACTTVDRRRPRS